MSLIEKLNLQKNLNASTGEKIRHIRKIKHITVKELSTACDVNTTSIRNYELGIRQVSDDKLDVIADRLDVNVSALYDRKIKSYTDVMHVLFELEDEFGLVPSTGNIESKIVLQTKDEILMEAIQSWYEKRYEYDEKKISREELKDWELSFPAHCIDDSVTHGEYTLIIPSNSEVEHVSSLKLALEQIELIVSDQAAQVSELLDSKDLEQAKYQLDILKRTIRSIIAADIKKYR